MSFTASPKDVQSPRREVSFVLSAREAGEVWRERRKVTTERRGPSSTTLSSSGVGGIHPLTFTSAFSMLRRR